MTLPDWYLAAKATQTPEPPDHGVRIHRAAMDPGFADQREDAVARIETALRAVASRHGFAQTRRAWTREGPLGRVAFLIQRSSYGFDCTIALGFLPKSGDPPPLWTDAPVTLAQFWGDAPVGPAGAGAIVYLDVIEDEATLDQPMWMLEHRALPWLLRHLTEEDAANRPFP